MAEGERGEGRSYQFTKASNTIIHIENAQNVTTVNGDNAVINVVDNRVQINQTLVTTPCHSSPSRSRSTPSVSPLSSCPPSSHRHSYPAASSDPTAIRYEPGPPQGVELLEVVQELMPVLGENWEILGQCLEIPDHEITATRVDESSLYKRINRLLKFWVNCEAENDRHKLVTLLHQVKGPPNLGLCVSQVLQKVQ